ncbi:hypothetical protein T265_09781 [Opisthorchis viverrini]|uniref:Uncharacterized protein n=1 Tax=Opisthorchis viverrini TaxID=6198 RepID=A0A074Z4N7_OPIVI|nr:hypothetical protein T265_09781 [Opisthorchis viverrini]KER22028.1 hypothetical protein T265_09781 [Opisthorchis viverrini]
MNEIEGSGLRRSLNSFTSNLDGSEMWAPWQYPSPRTTMNCTYTNKLVSHRPSRGAIIRVTLLAAYSKAGKRKHATADASLLSLSHTFSSPFLHPINNPPLLDDYCIHHSAVIPFRCLTATRPDESTKAEILPGFQRSDRSRRHSEVALDNGPFGQKVLTLNTETYQAAYNTSNYVRLLKIRRQFTTGFALLEAHQIDAVPEFPSTLFYLKPNCMKLAKYPHLQTNFVYTT